MNQQINHSIQERTGLADLQIGQRVKISGQYRDGQGFLAVEIICEPEADQDAKLEGLIQQADPDRKYIYLFDQKVSLPLGIEIKDLEGNRLNAISLQPGELVKIKGVYHAREGLVPRKITKHQTRDFNIEEIEGIVTQIDREKKRLTVNGVTIMVTPKTNFEWEEPLENQA
ncbi:MAG: DUF5666 domain-containing protein [candidate division KSB1 bacterium]|nr:DUF5666 domain-containing protein [candidate division KSB1 bacterium]